MVSFTSIPYAKVVSQWNRQTTWLHQTIRAVSVAAVIGIGAISVRVLGPRLPPLRELARMVTSKI
ncbi:hypothetical protein H4S00_005060 [Coemansia sp. D1744]|nr:hypothetical protein H4S00_005060 [Coemansia sp. D1744]